MDKRREAEFAEDMEVLVGALRRLGAIEPEPISLEVLSDLVGKRDEQLSILTDLAMLIRSSFDLMDCNCAKLSDGELCYKCVRIKRIDRDLATVREIDDE